METERPLVRRLPLDGPAEGEPVTMVAPSAVAAPEPEPVAAPSPPAAPAHRRWLWAGLEIVTSIVAALALPLWARTIRVDPLDRIGQVSGLAAIGLRYAVAAAVLLGLLLLAHRFLPVRHRPLVTRLGCTAVAGLATGLIAGGIVVALRDTPWALWVGDGDYRQVLIWIRMINEGQPIPHHYPPLIMYIIGGWGGVTGMPLAYALKDIQIVGTALFGPAAYLAWRLVLRPGWALGVGVVAMMPFVEPVKPYPQITLVMLVPVVIAFLQRIRRASELSLGRSALVGVVFGAGIGLQFLLYSGWFVWMAPGVALAFLVITPWRTALRRALLIAGTALATFTVVGWVHLQGLFSATGGINDAYFYADTYTDPAYIAMWRNDRPGGFASEWPPLGELGGVGVFTILLTIGLAVAIWLGWRRTAVIVLVSTAAGAWLIRMWLASEMYGSGLVRLYPRTTMIILYGLLILTGLAVMYAVDLVRRWNASRVEPLSLPSAVPAGLMLIPLVFFFAVAGSATADRYMPNESKDRTGYFSWIAQKQRLLDGTCPKYGKVHDLCR